MAMRLSILLFAFATWAWSGAAGAAPTLPVFDASAFAPAAPVDNPYFPMLDGSTRVFVSDDGSERFELTVLGAGPTILGVQTTVQRDRSFEDGLLVEDTFDYFAQDMAGNVWYLGEDVTNYIYDDDGNLVGTDTESSWRAGENFANPGGEPAQPGLIMPADAALRIGFNYYQEFAPDDEALDQATHIALLASYETDLQTYTDVLQVLETSELEPGSRGFKYYAPGAGLIAEEEGLDEDLANPELTFQLVRGVAEPATMPLTVVGLLWVGLTSRRRRTGSCKGMARAAWRRPPMST